MSHVASTPKRERAEEHRGTAAAPDRRFEAHGALAAAAEALS